MYSKFCILLLCFSRNGSGSRDMSQDRRAHHNALERKRRDHIKDSFTGLRDAIPTMQVSTHHAFKIVLCSLVICGMYCFFYIRW